MPDETSATLTILDVGHGNAAVLQDGESCYVFDGATGNSLVEFLSSRGVETVEAAVVSHTDEDHLAGVTTLLLDDRIKVRTIYVNSDALQESRSFRTFLSAIKWARENQATTWSPATTDLPGTLALSRGTIDVLAPLPEAALTGAGTTDLDGRPITRNGSSVVVRIVWEGVPVALICGDLDKDGLARLQEDGKDLAARTLVFPHHGGRPGSGVNAHGFAHDIGAAVQPEQVVFSFARRRFTNPRSEIVSGVLAACPTARVLCTQLSRTCTAELPGQPAPFHGRVVGAGVASGESCAGSVVLDLSSSTVLPERSEHDDFITVATQAPLCRVCRP